MSYPFDTKERLLSSLNCFQSETTEEGTPELTLIFPMRN